MSSTEAGTIETWSRVAGSAVETGAVEDVVVVPPDAPPEASVDLAWKRIDAGRRVRIVGRGVTTNSFIGALPGRGAVVLTELDAYLPSDKRPFQRAMEQGLSRWLETVFGDAVPGVSGRDAFWASAVTRLGLQDVFDAWCYVSGLASTHPTSEFVFTEPSWIGAAMLGSMVPAQSGKPNGASSPARRLLERVAFGTLGSAGAVVALLGRAREFIQEAPSRRLLRSFESGPAPSVWLGVNGAWEYSSRHVLNPLGAYAKKTGRKVGVLLQSSLRPGDLGDAHRGTRNTAAVLPVLSSDALEGTVSHVAQLVSHSTWAQALAAAPGTLTAMLRCTARVATHSSEIDFGPFRVPVTSSPRRLVWATTLDVLRAREAAAATRRLLAVTSLSGAHVALSQASLVADAVPDLLLQGAGATTFDVVHGALAEPLDMITTARTSSSMKLLWTHSEAKYLKGHTPPVCVGAVPSRTWIPRPRVPVHEPLRVLVLSNYGTFVGGGHRRRLPRVGYQEHLLDDVGALVRREKRQLALRWRPHPGDDRERVRLAGAAFGSHLEISRSPQLEEDLIWADLYITSLSSTVVEALAWDKPLLMHDIPIHEAVVLMSLFDRNRRFRNAEELAVAFDRAAQQLQGEEPLHEEQALRREFFGRPGVPASIAEVVFPK